MPHAQIAQRYAAVLQQMHPQRFQIIAQPIALITEAILRRQALLHHGGQERRTVGTVVAAAAVLHGKVRQLLGRKSLACQPLAAMADRKHTAAGAG